MSCANRYGSFIDKLLVANDVICINFLSDRL